MLRPLKKRGPTKGILLKGVFVSQLLNNPLASWINYHFLLSHTAYFDKSIILPFFVLATFGFLLSVCFLFFKQYDKLKFIDILKLLTYAFLIPAAIAQIFNPIAEPVIPIGIPDKEAKVYLERHPVIVEAKIRKFFKIRSNTL